MCIRLAMNSEEVLEKELYHKVSQRIHKVSLRYHGGSRRFLDTLQYMPNIKFLNLLQWFNFLRDSERFDWRQMLLRFKSNNFSYFISVQL